MRLRRRRVKHSILQRIIELCVTKKPASYANKANYWIQANEKSAQRRETYVSEFCPHRGSNEDAVSTQASSAILAMILVQILLSVGPTTSYAQDSITERPRIGVCSSVTVGPRGARTASTCTCEHYEAVTRWYE